MRRRAGFRSPDTVLLKKTCKKLGFLFAFWLHLPYIEVDEASEVLVHRRQAEESTMKYSEQLKTKAADNARGWLKFIQELHTAHLALSNGSKTSAEVDGVEYTDADEVREQADEQALSVEVRSGWQSVTSYSGEPAEYLIAITTPQRSLYGGPSLVIEGSLDANRQPTGVPFLMASQQGTGFFEVCGTKEEQAALEWFCSIFFYGE